MLYTKYTLAIVALMLRPIAANGSLSTDTTEPPYTTSPTSSYLGTTPPASCATVTVQGTNCPTLACTLPACLRLVPVTVSCGCESIYTTTTCASACSTGCLGTSYSPVIQTACSTTAPSTSTEPTTVPTTLPSSTTEPPVSSTTSPSGSPTGYSNTTITTTTTSTLTTCPATDTCTGQTTTWTGTHGPYTCTAAPTCVCVLPGNPGHTVTGGATVTVDTTLTTSQKTGVTGPTPTSSILSTNGGMRLGSDGIISGLIAVLVGLL